jgi:UDP-glucose 4-epimerase
MQADTTDCFYNVGSGEGTSIRELTELLFELTDLKMPIQYEPAGLTFVTRRIGDPTKAAAELGFRASMPLRDGLARLIEWRRVHQQDLTVRQMALV